MWRVMVLCMLLSAGSVWSFQLEDIADGTEELLDLSVEFSEDTPYWPTIEKKGQNFKIQETQNGYNQEYNYHFHATVFSSSDHGGTHVDALSHVNRNPVRDDIDQVPLRQFFGTAAVVDIAEKCRSNPDYELSIADVRAHESDHGRLPNGSLLFVYTGWGAKINDKPAFWGTPDYFNLSQLHYPGVSPAAAEWLVKNRKIKVVGVETGSVDNGQGGLSLQAHAIFLSSGVNIIESVQNLDKLPARGAFVFGLPMKMKGASGSPIRLVAVGWRKPAPTLRKRSVPGAA
ncbi:isatin hydrolase-like [Paramacrobiotus metropolitanus]|uniref:isatin hydrolase-like n=1 Tax=Paramacrobiotus metropolitanus TaxID=2943436 RepID=UPI00244568B7|nr:isatin hydrolase-like [Paramacrobiotus metropolitanus]XP_055342320.1 isatin hydrolase-like [Paramacrobiotus metropolitanus]